MTLLAQAIEFAHKYPTPHSHPNGGDMDWHNDCAAFCHRFALFTTPGFVSSVSGPTAYDVGSHSKIVSKDWRKAPVGAVIHFTTGVFRRKPGHIGWMTEEGMVSATNAGGGRELAPGVHIMLHRGVDAYLSAKPDMHLRGWSYDYAGGQIKLPSLSAAGLGTTPVHAPHPLKGDDEMLLISKSKDAAGYHYWATIPGQHVEISQAEAALFDGTANAKVDRSPDEMFNIQKLASKFQKPGGTSSAPIDYDKLATAVAAKLPTKFTGELS